jgi:hypothetical protein
MEDNLQWMTASNITTVVFSLGEFRGNPKGKHECGSAQPSFFMNMKQLNDIMTTKLEKMLRSSCLIFVHPT